MTSKQFETGWQHFLKCIDFNHSNLDAEAITFMNEMPAAAVKGLTPEKGTEQNEHAKTSRPARKINNANL